MSVGKHEPMDLSALAIVVPEAEPIVSPIRMRYDSSAARGAPAHITLIVPFVRAGLVDDTVCARIGAICSRHPSFGFSLSEIRRFSSALYLAPAPDEPFHRLLRELVETFPDHPPYEGAFDRFVPHLTIADSEALATFDEIAMEFAQLRSGELPIACRAEAVTLFVLFQGRWSPRFRFSLGTRAA